MSRVLVDIIKFILEAKAVRSVLVDFTVRLVSHLSGNLRYLRDPFGTTLGLNGFTWDTVEVLELGTS